MPKCARQNDILSIALNNVVLIAEVSSADKIKGRGFLIGIEVSRRKEYVGQKSKGTDQ